MTALSEHFYLLRCSFCVVTQSTYVVLEVLIPVLILNPKEAVELDDIFWLKWELLSYQNKKFFGEKLLSEMCF